MEREADQLNQKVLVSRGTIFSSLRKLVGEAQPAGTISSISRVAAPLGDLATVIGTKENAI